MEMEFDLTWFENPNDDLTIILDPEMPQTNQELCLQSSDPDPNQVALCDHNYCKMAPKDNSNDDDDDEDDPHIEINADDNDEEESGKSKTLPWYAGCEYRCQFAECLSIFYTENHLRRHVERHHCVFLFYAQEFHNKLVTKARYVQCQECQVNMKVIQHNYESINEHLRLLHNGMSVEQYGIKHGLDDYIVAVEGQDIAEEDVVVVKDTLFEIWSNKCVFQCNICSSNFNKESSFHEHLRLMHRLTKHKYEVDHGSTTLAKVAFHRCKICSKQVRHCHNFLTKHLQNQHGINIKDYYDKYVKAEQKNDNSVLYLMCEIHYEDVDE